MNSIIIDLNLSSVLIMARLTTFEDMKLVRFSRWRFPQFKGSLKEATENQALKGVLTAIIALLGAVASLVPGAYLSDDSILLAFSNDIKSLLDLEFVTLDKSFVRQLFIYGVSFLLESLSSGVMEESCFVSGYIFGLLGILLLLFSGLLWDLVRKNQSKAIFELIKTGCLVIASMTLTIVCFIFIPKVLLEEMEAKDLQGYQEGKDSQDSLESLARRDRKEKLEKKEKRDIQDCLEDLG